MMEKCGNIDEEQLERWKDTFAKDGIIYETDNEYHEAIGNFVGFIDVLIEIDRKIKKHSDQARDDHLNELYLLDKDGNKIIL